MGQIADMVRKTAASHDMFTTSAKGKHSPEDVGMNTNIIIEIHHSTEITTNRRRVTDQLIRRWLRRTERQSVCKVACIHCWERKGIQGIRRRRSAI